ncbi:aminoglycoside phosphotransferase family protein [Streptosporangium sp. NPDC006007]|uniref:phosphotransferase family protein n=1 Tax=Streptosporangium sp. NPDC006007 TaxID=3154575 RepID=UPI0033A29386
MFQLVGIVELSVDQVAAAIGQLLPDAVPVRPRTALRTGRSHASWVFDSGRGALVGKAGQAGHSDVVLRRLAEHRRVWRHGVPVPRLLAFSASDDLVGGRLLIVSEYLPGHDAEDAAGSLHPAAMGRVIAETGAALARLHSVPVKAFGDALTGLGADADSWSVAVASRIESLSRAYRDHETDSGTGDLVPSGLALLGALSDSVSRVVRPAVAHLDVYLPNILVDDAGRFRVLLDLEHLRWVDPVMDFVKPAMWMFEKRPQWAEQFVSGYRMVSELPQLWHERLSVAGGLELLTGVDYWTRVSDRSMRDDYLQRLRAWVRSDGAVHMWPSSVK